jgi:hypothetical protein
MLQQRFENKALPQAGVQPVQEVLLVFRIASKLIG